ncbi:probable serine/threonine-protein kinase At1g54610 [Coffea arabica]|uniref:Probable serine/threonine-protein kinase At1g54610 n=1 Tax=Coffea arabica TaxID=13443 RepID=A0A6P6UJN2_COFAR
MGCTQGRPSMNSPPPGLQKLKMENGYDAKGGYAAARRSTGQRHYTIGAGQLFRHESRHEGGSGKTSTGRRGSHEKKPITREEARISYDGGEEGGNYGRGGTTSSAENKGSQEKKLINLEVQTYSSSANGGVGTASVPTSSTRREGEDGELVDGWPKWLIDNIPRDALEGLIPRSAETYDKIDKIGQGTYSNVYKARDKYTRKIVAMKKVRFDTTEPESVKFMAREIRILRKLDHPNVVKLEGLATSRMHYSLYLVFDYMQCDLASIITRPDERLTEPQVKCYMHQLLSGLQHCHEKGILHRDIKGSNLLIDKKGMLKIADFGLANYYNPEKKRPLTSRVVTLWYRAPELLLGATEYGIGIDLWSAGCLMAEMFIGRPIMPGRTEVEQVHKIFKLCGTPSNDFWKRAKVATTFRPPQTYKPRLREAFRNFPASSVGLLSTLLALDPATRGSAASALQDEFFCTSPLACDLSGLPVTYKEEDEEIQRTERRKHRRSKMRHRSQSHIVHRNKDIAAEKPGDPGRSEEPEKSAETITLSQGPGSSATSTSSSGKTTIITSFDAADMGNKESLPRNLASPDIPNRQNSSRTEARPQANKNIKNRPPLPDPKRSSRYNMNINDKNDNIIQFREQVQRSISTREHRNRDLNKLLELHAVD